MVFQPAGLALASRHCDRGRVFSAPAHNLCNVLMAVLVALLLDRLWGEPPMWLHPVVYMGKLLGGLGRLLAPRAQIARDYKRFMLAAIVWCALAAMVFAIYWTLQFCCLTSPGGCPAFW